MFPADSDVPLPPNPILEAYALHGKKAKPITTTSHAEHHQTDGQVAPDAAAVVEHQDTPPAAAEQLSDDPMNLVNKRPSYNKP